MGTQSDKSNIIHRTDIAYALELIDIAFDALRNMRDGWFALSKINTLLSTLNVDCQDSVYDYVDLCSFCEKFESDLESELYYARLQYETLRDSIKRGGA